MSREQLFVMFARAMGIEPKASSDTAFADSGEVSSWAAGYINALADMGAIQGSGDGTLNPSGDMNRASFVAVLDQTISGLRQHRRGHRGRHPGHCAGGG